MQYVKVEVIDRTKYAFIYKFVGEISIKAAKELMVQREGTYRHWIHIIENKNNILVLKGFYFGDRNDRLTRQDKEKEEKFD